MTTNRKGKAEWRLIDAEIIDKLDIMAEYRAMGVEFDADVPRSSGKASCYAVGRPPDKEDTRPSAYIDINTGRYGDSGSSEKEINIWEFAAKFGPRSQFTGDWKQCRAYFAEKAGVQLGKSQPGKKSSGEKPDEKLTFVEWTPGHDELAIVWLRRKPGIASLSALKLCGARIARYPSGVDKTTGVRYEGRYTCLALPVWQPPFYPDTEPCAWVIWNMTGDFETKNPRDGTITVAKMKTSGPSHGGLMNPHALRILRDESRAGVALVWKTAGPTDMLALQAIVPEQLRSSHLVITNASGEVTEPMVSMLSGLRVYVAGDRDTAGNNGDKKWIHALRGDTSHEARRGLMPYKLEEKHGKDLRDLIAGELSK